MGLTVSQALVLKTSADSPVFQTSSDIEKSTPYPVPTSPPDSTISRISQDDLSHTTPPSCGPPSPYTVFTRPHERLLILILTSTMQAAPLTATIYLSSTTTTRSTVQGFHSGHDSDDLLYTQSSKAYLRSSSLRYRTLSVASQSTYRHTPYTLLLALA